MLVVKNAEVEILTWPSRIRRQFLRCEAKINKEENRIDVVFPRKMTV